MYGVNPAKQTWLPVDEVARTLGLDGPQQVQELAEAYGMTAGTMPDGGIMGLLIPPKVRLRKVSGMRVCCGEAKPTDYQGCIGTVVHHETDTVALLNSVPLSPLPQCTWSGSRSSLRHDPRADSRVTQLHAV